MDTFSRRGFATSLLSLPLLAALPNSTLARSQDGTVKGVTPLDRIKIGRFEVTFLSDGFIDIPFAMFTGATAEQVEQAAATYFAARPNGIRSGFTIWLIRDGDKLILVDSGAAGTVSKTSGRLSSALAAIGVRPEMIDAVIVTHMHVDHIAGLVAGERANFPNAELYIDRRDVAHFTDPAKAAAAPEFLKSSFATAEQLVKLYPRLQRIDGERQISPGVSTVDLCGHTPGHTGVRIEDSGRGLLLVGDMFWHPALHPHRPDLGIVFEADKAAAEAMRRRFFPRAAEEKALVAATHMPFPGLGRIVKDGGGLRWLAADWEYSG